MPETYSTPIYYKNKNCEHAITFYVTLSLRPIKKENPVSRENKKSEDNFHLNCVLKQMHPKLCVTKIYSLKDHMSTI